MKRIRLSTSHVNRYGYRVLTEGIDLSSFLLNPVMLYQHGRGEEKYPIGRWDDIKVENGELTATPVFDDEDEIGAKVKSKYERGFLHAASVWIDPLETSSDASLMMPGQTRPTVTRSSVLEASFVDIPGNQNAVKLALSGSTQELDLDTVLPTIISKPTVSMDKVKLALGLPADATEEQVCAAVTAMKAHNTNMVLALGKANGHVTPDNEQHYKALATAAPDACLALLGVPAAKAATTPATAAAPAAATDTPAEGYALSLSELLTRLGTREEKGDERANWSFNDWSKKDPDGLNKMRLETPDKYKALAAAVR